MVKSVPSLLLVLASLRAPLFVFCLPVLRALTRFETDHALVIQLCGKPRIEKLCRRTSRRGTLQSWPVSWLTTREGLVS